MDFKADLKIFYLQTPSSSFGACLSALGHSLASHVGPASSSLLPIHRFQPDLILVELQTLSVTLRDTTFLLEEFPDLPVLITYGNDHRPDADKILDLLPQCFLLDQNLAAESLDRTLRHAISLHRFYRTLSKNQRDIEHLLHGFNQGILVVNQDGEIQWLNEAAASLLATPAKLAIGSPLALLCQLSTTEGEPISATQLGADPKILTATNRQRDSVPILVRLHRITDQHGISTGFALLFKPYRVAASVATLSPKSLIKTLNNRFEFWCTDLSGNVLSRSTLTESSEKEDKNQLSDLFPQVDTKQINEHLKNAAFAGYAPLLIQKKDSTPQLLHTLQFPSFLLNWVSDSPTTEPDEEERRKHERLDSLGLLARGFAHDFNNLLTILSGHLSLGIQKVEARHDDIQELETAQNATLEAQSLVQQLLTFARGGSPIKQQVRLHRFLQEFLNLHIRKSDISYFLNLAQPDIEIDIDPNQIRRVLSNLLKNAEQALSHRLGMITVSCRLKKSCSINVENADTQIEAEIQVRDTGEGISSERLGKVFEPYFSTKQSSNATGLGLTVCESIIKAHGGQIKIQSHEGEETVVTITLPAKSAGSPPERKNDSLPLTVEQKIQKLKSNTTESVLVKKTGPKRVLLLDDEQGIRNLVRLSLSNQPYEVVETEDGLDTIRRYHDALKEGRRFDLVILDLSVPNGMGGLQTMSALQQLDPQVKAVVSSGYSDDAAMSKPDQYGFIDVLPKPYLPKDLILMLRKHLS